MSLKPPDKPRVKRVVFASSNHAVGMCELDQPYARIRQGDYTGLEPATVPRVDHTVRIGLTAITGLVRRLGKL